MITIEICHPHPTEIRLVAEILGGGGEDNMVVMVVVTSMVMW